MIWILSIVAIIALITALVQSFARISAVNKAKRQKQLDDQQWNDQMADIMASYRKK